MLQARGDAFMIVLYGNEEIRVYGIYWFGDETLVYGTGKSSYGLLAYRLDDCTIVDPDLSDRFVYFKRGLFHHSLIEQNLLDDVVEHNGDACNRFIEILKDEGIIPDSISIAVVEYLGYGISEYPDCDMSRMVVKFGKERAEELISKIDLLLADLDEMHVINRRKNWYETMPQSSLTKKMRNELHYRYQNLHETALAALEWAFAHWYITQATT